MYKFCKQEVNMQFSPSNISPYSTGDGSLAVSGPGKFSIIRFQHNWFLSAFDSCPAAICQSSSIKGKALLTHIESTC